MKAEELETGIVKVPTPGETVWMIEKSINGVAHWWTRYDGQDEYWDKPERWTTDPNKARKYVSKEVAEYVMGKDMVGCTATRHIWM